MYFIYLKLLKYFLRYYKYDQFNICDVMELEFRFKISWKILNMSHDITYDTYDIYNIWLSATLKIAFINIVKEVNMKNVFMKLWYMIIIKKSNIIR